MSDATQVQRPADLANRLFDAFLSQSPSDPREAARLAINFMREALVIAILGSASDEIARKALLKSVGESIIAAVPPPKP